MKCLLTIVSFFLLTCPALSSEHAETVAGFPEDEALRLGERMYREGILPSGEPMQAVIMGDIPVDGRMFTCDDCHQRSGLGSKEGTVITWPTNGKELSRTRKRTGAWRRPEDNVTKQTDRKDLPPYWQIEDVRPAYTDESLASVLWTGVDPAGRKLDPIMPLYNLEDRDMAIMVHYLNNLSVDIAPGVDAKTLHFATVVSDEVAEKDRQAMLLTLQAHMDAHNSQSRHEERRMTSGPFYKTEMHQAYRNWQLDVWELKGPESTWPRQLQTYYSQQPVFALLGGIVSGSWQHIHEFSEQNKIPTIFPVTDFPVISETDWYTLYFSKGFYQEGETAARFLHIEKNIGPDAEVIVVSRDNQESNELVRGFTETWKKSGRTEPEYLQLAPGEKATGEFWKEIKKSLQQTVLILWLDKDDLGEVDTLAQGENRPQMIVMSSELLDNSFATIPDELRDFVYLTHPYNLPGDNERRRLVIKRWMEVRNVPLTNFEIQAKMYFLGWMLTGGVKHLRSEFFREYFLEGFDMMTDQDYAIAVYPRLTFGPGQRYASKGCYIVQVTGGENPELVKKSDWVIH